MSLTSRPLPDEPSWPDAQGRPVTFLLDAASGLERRILEAWIERARPDCCTPDSYDIVRIPSSRRRRGRVDGRLEDKLAAAGDPLLAPLRVAWLAPLRDGERTVGFRDVLKLGDPRDPSRLRQRLSLWRHPDRCRIVAGAPAPASELRDRWLEACGAAGGITVGLAGFVALQAALALERAERGLRGARYKVPRFVHEEILGRPAFRGGLAEISRREGRSEARLARDAGRVLREIAATHSPFVIDLGANLIRMLYTQGYSEALQYDRQKLTGVYKLAQQHPVVFLPSHKSNLDHLVLQYAMHENGLPPNHTAAGINMNFFPVGPLVRRTGGFFIRRSFKDDELYKHVLRSYIDYLIEKRFSLEWYIEGGRSRLGKLLPPRFGLLAYVIDAYRRGKSDDVFLIPVSIAYDQIEDVGSYAAEQRGAAKERESLGWFLRMIRGLRRRYGSIHINFGEPLSLRSQVGPPIPGATPDPDERDLELQKVAFEVSVRINRVTPITPTSLVALALIGTGDRALSVPQTRRSLANLVAYVIERKLPTSTEIEHLQSDEGVRSTLEALADNGVVSRFDEGPETVYMIGPEQQLTAAYYQNAVLHFVGKGAIAELSLLCASDPSVDDPIDEFWNEAMRLRDLLKFDFFFAEKEVFRRELREELLYHEPDWEKQLAKGHAAVQPIVQGFRPFSAHRVLRPYLESYRVVAEVLAASDPEQPIETEPFLDQCLALGKQQRLQRRIHSAASVSKVIFKTALSLASNRGLLGVDEPEDLQLLRSAFAEEIADALRRVDAIDALARSRRAGLIP